MEKILAVKDVTYAVAERKPDKKRKIQACRDSNPNLLEWQIQGEGPGDQT